MTIDQALKLVIQAEHHTPITTLVECLTDFSYAMASDFSGKQRLRWGRYHEVFAGFEGWYGSDQEARLKVAERLLAASNQLDKLREFIR